jgi:hypothetical protein
MGVQALSRGGRLVLLKAVLEGIPVYWNSIASNSQRSFREGVQVELFSILGSQNFPGGIHLANWASIVVPKEYGG